MTKPETENLYICTFPAAEVVSMQARQIIQKRHHTVTFVIICEQQNAARATGSYKLGLGEFRLRLQVF